MNPNPTTVYYVRSSTNVNRHYEVSLDAHGFWVCECKAAQYRRNVPCKHVLQLVAGCGLAARPKREGIQTPASTYSRPSGGRGAARTTTAPAPDYRTLGTATPAATALKTPGGRGAEDAASAPVPAYRTQATETPASTGSVPSGGPGAGGGTSAPAPAYRAPASDLDDLWGDGGRAIEVVLANRKAVAL